MSPRGRPEGARGAAPHEVDAVRPGRVPIRVTVVWATQSVQDVVVVDLPPDATVAAAVKRSGFVAAYGLDLDQTGYSVDGRRAWPATALADGSRVDLVRPLQVDPQTIRRLRAQARPLRPMSKPDRRRRV